MNVSSRRTKLPTGTVPLIAALALLAYQPSTHAVVGGDEPGFFEHPWLAQISIDGVEYEHVCGGALIAPSWVVTAAHCVAGHSESEVTVTFGEYTRSWVGDFGEQVRFVAEFVEHPYENDYNDIVLLRLTQPVNITTMVYPIAIADGDYDPGTMMTIAGWGHTNYLGPEPSDVLQEASFPLVSNEVCKPVVQGGGTLEAKMLCGGVVDGPAMCNGDSGGPMVVENASGDPEMIGIVSFGREQCKAYSVGVRIRDYKPWIEQEVFGARPPVCSGRTAPGVTPWQNGSSGVIFVDIDTTACGWEVLPQYFTSLGGDGSHYTIDGATAIFAPSMEGFRVFLYKSGLTAEEANDRHYHINWQSSPLNTNVMGLCTGRSSTTAWQVHGTNAIYIDVSTSACGLSSTPSYFTSLLGLAGHDRARGVTSIYSATENGFRVYLQRAGITPQLALSQGWRIQWRAESVTLDLDDVCNGKTSTASTSWVQSGANRVYTDVNTSACSLHTTPKFFPVVGGNSSHYTARTVSSVYSPTPDGFRVYLESSGITPALANQRNWHVRWNALP